MYSDCTPDYIKMTALNIPAAVVVSYAMRSHSMPANQRCSVTAHPFLDCTSTA